MKTHFSKVPVSVYDFMNYALYDEHNGYYMKKTPMGDKNADFITAPELSPIFGEVIAFWILNRIFEYNGQINILELGPGKGTLAKDILTTIKKLSSAHFANTDYNLLEISPTLKKVQANNLAEFSNVKWLDKITDLSPNKLNIVIANEFFDALPVRQYQKKDNQYYERLINENNEFILANQPTFIGKNYNEDIVEIYPDLKQILIELKHINAQMLFIDYGNLGTSETLQAVKNHQKVSIFEDITNSDLTTQVDFRQIIKEFDGLAEINISNMADFLLANGILTRAEQLLKNSNEQQTQNLNFVLNKLLQETQMGKIFKALEISFLD